MQFLNFIIPSITQFYIILFLLRFWIQWNDINVKNMFFHFVYKSTDFIYEKIYSIFPINTLLEKKISSLITSYMFVIAHMIFTFWMENYIHLINKISILIISLIQLFTYFGKVIFWIVIGKILFNWKKNMNYPLSETLNLLIRPIIFRVNKITSSCNGDYFSCIVIVLILVSLNYLRMDLISLIDTRAANILSSSYHKINYN
ncbi:YggT family protein [Candidatus Riesia pediculischaeffi]|uniref:Integral membrane protein YggT, involved in response to extracytoplasmic stress (Osmotic shock) n=1 Tax=Candidatus Riesia pediculischaeffi PTSU TaxID=1401651 RepID=A0A0C1S9Q9_9ENTR|nr:YggT family protein [Candidatus Riesia pediculischaeffi]KIE64021.1 Integral membrane protein YggT, involved in response to extracytoplasmic stress (osmotic shock) [Candidatus Riesia pediculischaeffi PTSU]